jgi:hypothetical protein
MKINYIIPFVLIVLSSCFSSLKVKVDSLNMPAYKSTYLYKSEYITKLESKILSQVNDEMFTEIKRKTVDVAVNFVLSNSKYFTNESDSKGQMLITTIKGKFNEAKINLLKDASNLLGTIHNYKSNPTNLNETNLNSSLLAYDKTLTLFKIACHDLADLVIIESTKSNNEALISKAENIKETVINNLNQFQSKFGDSVLSDPNASIIASLPEMYWVKFKRKHSLSDTTLNPKTIGDKKYYKKYKTSHYNTTIARTFFGNSDIAIKMESPGEFTIKGVRVDADEAVKTSFKVLNQGIKYLAYAQGIPVAGTSTSSKNNVVIPELEKSENSAKVLNQKIKNEEDKLNALITILIESIKEKDDKKGKEIDTARIQKAYINLIQ